MSSVQGDGSGDLVTIRDSAYFFRVPSIAATDLRGIIRFQHVALAGDRSDPLPRPVLLALADLVPADMVEYFEMRRDQSTVAYSTDHDVREPAGVADAVTELGRLNRSGRSDGHRPTGQSGSQKRSTIERSRHPSGMTPT